MSECLVEVEWSAAGADAIEHIRLIQPKRQDARPEHFQDNHIHRLLFQLLANPFGLGAQTGCPVQNVGYLLVLACGGA